MSRQSTMLAVAALAAAASVPYSPSLQRDGLRMSDEERERRSSERAKNAEKRIANAHAKRERRAHRQRKSGDG